MDEVISGFVTIDTAAKELDLKPWEVVRLMGSGELGSIELVNADSLRRYKEAQ